MSRRKVQLVLLCEDRQHEAFLRRFLELDGWHARSFRVERNAKPGSGEQWVRVRYPDELRKLRATPHISKGLIVCIDEDTRGAGRREEQLADSLAPELSDQEFLAAVSRECPSSRELIENTLLEKFASGLTGYQIGVLVQLLSSASKLSCEIAGLNAAHDLCATDFIADFLPDFRMLAPEVRYEQTEDFNNVKETLANHVRATIRSPRIQARVIKLIDYLAELIRGGEDMRLMTQAEIARRLGVSYSTLNEDFVRLRSSKVVPFIAEANSES